MSVKGMNPYAFFNGTAEKAAALYERALEARTESLQRFGEANVQLSNDATITDQEGTHGRPNNER